MARRTQIRTKAVQRATEVLVLIHHPMETGQRIDSKTKQKIPPHFVQKVIFTLNGIEVASANLGVAVSENPLIGVRVKGAKTGDTVGVTWSDNKGENGDVETTIG